MVCITCYKFSHYFSPLSSGPRLLLGRGQKAEEKEVAYKWSRRTNGFTSNSGSRKGGLIQAGNQLKAGKNGCAEQKWCQHLNLWIWFSSVTICKLLKCYICIVLVVLAIGTPLQWNHHETRWSDNVHLVLSILDKCNLDVFEIQCCDDSVGYAFGRLGRKPPCKHFSVILGNYQLKAKVRSLLFNFAGEI